LTRIVFDRITEFIRADPRFKTTDERQKLLTGLQDFKKLKRKTQVQIYKDSKGDKQERGEGKKKK